MTSGSAADILAQWREVERLLAEAIPGSTDAQRLEAECARLCAEYQNAVMKATEPVESARATA